MSWPSTTPATSFTVTPLPNNLLQRKVEPDCTYEELLGDMHPFEEVLGAAAPNYVEEELKVGERTLDVYLAPFPTTSRAVF